MKKKYYVIGFIAILFIIFMTTGGAKSEPTQASTQVNKPVDKTQIKNELTKLKSEMKNENDNLQLEILNAKTYDDLKNLNNLCDTYFSQMNNYTLLDGTPDDIKDAINQDQQTLVLYQNAIKDAMSYMDDKKESEMYDAKQQISLAQDTYTKVDSILTNDIKNF